MEENIEHPKEIKVPVWYRTGDGMAYRRDCLSTNDPESTYQYIKNVLGLTPEEYGYRTEEAILHEEYNSLNKKELIQKIIDLENDLLFYMKYGG